MSFSDYVGQSLGGNGETIVRVAPHRLWQPEGERIEPCTYSGEELVLSEKHLLVVLEKDGIRSRLYFRDEESLNAWLDEHSEAHQ
ncbi:hypothetical protein ACFQJC_11900 [Haloferax namakaokahaiae]|uniref:Uncharacterized protein n=1 Tax=Haloferax namakaokahaiae TaxID=1748331 RepID=A0ABD5ZGZ3_9EURY